MTITKIPVSPRQHGGDNSKPPKVSGSNQRKIRRALGGTTGRRSHADWREAPTALAIIESLPTKTKPSPVSVFGQLGRAELAGKPAQRLSPAMSRRLKRRGRNLVQAAVLMLQEEAARNARLAREAEAKAKFKPQCSARTKLGTRCRKTAVADGYCATHGA